MATDLFSLPLGVLHRICYFLPSSSSVTYFLENDLDHRAPPLTQELPILDLGSLSRFSRSSRALHILTTPFLYSTAAQDQIQDYAVETHLHHAAAVGNDRAIRAILHHRPNAISRLLEADSNQCYCAYRRPIFCAAAGGHLSTIQLLHSLGDDPKESDANIFGVGALNYAALNGHLEACQLILKLVGGYNPGYNTPDFQHTPLFWAAMSGHLDIVDYFIASGADPNSETPDGENMLHWLAKQYSTFLHDMTRPYGSPEGSYEAAKLLIHRGTNPELSFQPDEEKPEEYETPLSLALRHGNIPVARALLIDGRVNPNRALADEDPNGDRALHYLARHPPADIAHYRNEWIYVGSFVLLMKFGGAKLEMLNRRGYTPFLVAVRELNPVAVRVLLENGANPDARTRKGKPALQVLIEGWAAAKDGRSQDPMGEALHPDLMTEQQKEDMRKREEAATENALKVFGELVQVLEAGAVNRNLGKWGTPLLVAVKKEAVWAVRMLLLIGANPHLPDRRGVTPVLEASHRSNDAISTLLANPCPVPFSPNSPAASSSSFLPTPSPSPTAILNPTLTGPPTIPPSLHHAISTFWDHYLDDLNSTLGRNPDIPYHHCGSSTTKEKQKEMEGELVWEEDYGNYFPEKGEFLYWPSGEMVFMEYGSEGGGESDEED